MRRDDDLDFVSLHLMGKADNKDVGDGIAYILFFGFIILCTLALLDKIGITSDIVMKIVKYIFYPSLWDLYHGIGDSHLVRAGFQFIIVVPYFVYFYVVLMIDSFGKVTHISPIRWLAFLLGKIGGGIAYVNMAVAFLRFFYHIFMAFVTWLF